MCKGRGLPLTGQDLEIGGVYEVVCRSRTGDEKSLYVLRLFGDKVARFFELEVEIPAWASGIVVRKEDEKIVLIPHDHPIW